MTLVSIGTIDKLQLHDNGYYKLTVYIPCPETKYLRFCVFKADLLQNKETGKEFQIGNKVRVIYHLVSKKRYPFLDELIPAKFDDCCPLCDSSLDEILLREMNHLDIS